MQTTSDTMTQWLRPPVVRTNVAARLIYALRALRRRGSHHLGCRPRHQWTMHGIY
jgi:hypothetical protein